MAALYPKYLSKCANFSLASELWLTGRRPAAAVGCKDCAKLREIINILCFPLEALCVWFQMGMEGGDQSWKFWDGAALYFDALWAFFSFFSVSYIQSGPYFEIVSTIKEKKKQKEDAGSRFFLSVCLFFLTSCRTALPLGQPGNYRVGDFLIDPWLNPSFFLLHPLLFPQRPVLKSFLC